MPKQALKAEFNSFLKGLITEASPLKFPEEAFQEGVNFELTRRGMLSRRLGFNVEAGHQWIDSGIKVGDIEPKSYSVFLWPQAGGAVGYDIVVVQVRNKFFLFDAASDAISDGLIEEIEFSTFENNTDFSCTIVNNNVVVACGNQSLGLISYNPTEDVFEKSLFRITTRDVWGVPCTTVPRYDTDPTYRGGLDMGHIYNLQNQSWGISRKASGGPLIDPVSYYHNYYHVYPSNTETVWAGLQYKSGDPPAEVLYDTLWGQVLNAGDVKAAKGYFIIDALQRGLGRKRAFSENYDKYTELKYKSIDVDSDETLVGAKVVTEFAGRVWYAGFGGTTNNPHAKSPDLSNHVFFSQLVANKSDYGKCYQEGDPTSRATSDIVDTDGGFIKISGARDVVGLRVCGSSLVVLASNGVWVVSGGSEYGFTATNYKVDRISVYGCSAPGSVVDDGSKVFFWGEEGIFVVSRDQMGNYVCSSLSETTIKTFYDEISWSDKGSCKAIYDSIDNIIRWVYRDGDVSKELLLDLSLSAFYPFTISNHPTYDYQLRGGVLMPTYKLSSYSNTVLANSNSVTVGDESVVVGSTTQVSTAKSVKFLVFFLSGTYCEFTFAQYNNAQFLDWGVTDAPAYVLTGSYSLNDSSTKKAITYITTHMKMTETGATAAGLTNPSGCQMRTRWGWSLDESSNNWSQSQQIYRINRMYFTSATGGTFNPGYELVTAKSKVRGSGRAFAVEFTSEPSKDCQIVGWSMAVTGNAIV